MPIRLKNMIVQRIWWCSDGESAGVGVDYICAAIDITDGNEPRQRRRDIVASRVPAATTSGTVTCSSLGVAARSKWNALVIA